MPVRKDVNRKDVTGFPKLIKKLVYDTETLETPYPQELEDIASVIKCFVKRYRRRAFYDYFAKDEDKRREIRKQLGMRWDSIEEWLRAKTRALLTYWLESDDIEHTEAMERVLDMVEDIWYDLRR